MTERAGVEIVGGQEPWAEIYLADGNKLRVRITVQKCYLRVGETTPDGMPAYDIDAQMSVQAFANGHARSS